MRRYTDNMNGERYLANTSPSKKEVDDLDNEQTNCQINEIIKAGHKKPFTSQSTANAAGYDNCAYCLGKSSR